MSHEEQRAAVIAEARSWIGTPYHHQGRLRGVGVDCGYFLFEVFSRVLNLPQADFGYYPEDWMMHREAERYLVEVEARCRRIEIPEPGDVALFRWGRCYAHGAIIIEWPRVVVHAYGSTRGSGGVEYADAGQPPLAGRHVLFFSPWK